LEIIGGFVMYYSEFDSPIGALFLYSNGDALTGLHFRRAPESTPADSKSNRDVPLLRRAHEQLRAYFEGDLTQFDLPLLPEGTPFQLRVWGKLEEIPYGETISYRQLAERIGNPSASRAVGAANGSNPLAIVVPCHRVIGANGLLVGYGGGLPIKQRLLELEARVSFRLKPPVSRTARIQSA
jgi:methylated-DNA-[protein]-cysteine S-methyltransferase